MKKNQKAKELKRILIVGSGGRENSIAWALSKNQSIIMNPQKPFFHLSK